MKVDLKVWNRDVFGHLDTTKRNISKEIEDLDNQNDNSKLKGSARLKRMDLDSQLKVINNKIDSLLRQKARSYWLKYGDSNTKFSIILLSHGEDLGTKSKE